MEKPTTPPPIGDVSKAGGILATSILALSLVLIFIALRFATRIWLVKRVGWDDWCIVFAGVRNEPYIDDTRRLLSALVWPYHWHGLDICSTGIRLWKTRLLPDRTTTSSVHEIRIRRMASGLHSLELRQCTVLTRTDFCDADVHEDLDLPFSATYYRYQDFYSTFVRGNLHPCRQQCHYQHHMDRSV